MKGDQLILETFMVKLETLGRGILKRMFPSPLTQGDGGGVGGINKNDKKIKIN